MDRMKAYLTKNQKLADKYRQILSSEWTFATMKESLKLANALLNSCHPPLGFSQLTQDHTISDLADLFTSFHLTHYLQDQSAMLDNKKLPGVPEKMPKRRSPPKIECARLTFEVIYDLAFPMFSAVNAENTFAVKGDIGFLRDVQSLVFTLSADFLLPLLRERRLKEESDYLNLVMFAHGLLVWHDQPAHQRYLFSIVFDNMGRHEAVLDCLHAAFRLTAPEDHDYLTKAQAYWTALIDAEMLNEAKEFALKLLRHSPEAHFDEIKEMIELSFELAYA